MTKIIIEKINCVEDLYMFSKAFKEELIQIYISKISKHLNKDWKIVKKYLLGDIPKRYFFTIFQSLFKCFEILEI